MSFFSRMRGEVKIAALWGGVAVAVLCIALGGTGFLVVALFLGLLHFMPAVAAAAVTGSGTLLLAVIVAAIGAVMLRRRRRRQPSMLADFGGGLGLAARLVGLMVRKDPRKAIILSVIAGALAEYVTSERKD